MIDRIKGFLQKHDGQWQKIAIIALAFITVVSVIITVVVVNGSSPVLAPDFAPIDVDENAEVLSDSDTAKMEHEEGGAAVSLTYSNEVKISLDKKEAYLLFQNPAKSTQDMVLQIVVTSGDKEVVIAQSDKLPPGYMLRTMKLLDTAKLSVGGYNGRFNVLFYDPDNGERAIVNTNIPITITVK